MQTLSERVRRLGPALDSQLAGWATRRVPTDRVGSWVLRTLETPVGPVRLVDTESDKPCVVLVPDGPNVIEHYAALVARLAPELRVVCFDMPGFGFSRPRGDYTHSLAQGSDALLGVLDGLGVPRATLAFSCANGLYALHAARRWPERIASLFLSQTPSLRAMLAWSQRMIPAPLHVPVVGQMATWLSRKALAMRWYGMSLPRTTEVEPFRAPARRALADGAAFSLAGVVQGLQGQVQAQVEGVDVPCCMLWGSQDRTHRHTDPESLLECAPGAHIVRCSDCGHFPDLENPRRFADLLLTHIAEL